MSRLADQIRQVLPAFSAMDTPPALIGGLALAVHRVVRATSDVDFLVAADDADRVHELLLSLGYECVHRSADAANYCRGDEGFDLLYAHRPNASRLLQQAEIRDTPLGRLGVISSMICLPKVADATPNTPFAGDVGSDAHAVQAPHDPVAAWLSLMEVVEALCPEWPKRDTASRGGAGSDSRASVVRPSAA